MRTSNNNRAAGNAAALVQAWGEWTDAGCHAHPATPDGSKHAVSFPGASSATGDDGKYGWGYARIRDGALPAVTLEQFAEMVKAGKTDGIVVFCGPPSGELEMLEVEGRAVELLPRIKEHADELGREVAELLERVSRGCVQRSPSGGVHFIYRVDGQALGNTPLAARPDGTAKDGKLVLAETRGAGGLFVAAPSGGRTHKSGKPYTLERGSPATIPTLTTAERDTLYTLFRLIDEMPVEPPREEKPRQDRRPGDPDRPGDEFNARASWGEILKGWKMGKTVGDRQHWTRPGKSKGTSATTTENVLCCFSSSAGLPAFNPATGTGALSKFGAYAALHHGGDYSAAASALRSAGYGAVPVPADPAAVPVASGQVCPARDLPQYADAMETRLASRFVAQVRGRLAYVRERCMWLAFDGRRWAERADHVAVQEAKRMHDQLWAELVALGPEERKAALRFVQRTGTKRMIDAVLGLAKSDPGASVSQTEFDAHPWLLNVENGVVDLRTGDLLQHDPELRLTQVAAVAYDPDARSELWERFIREVTCGDDEIAAFLQRSFGIALTGDVSDEVLHCHSGGGCNGKSTALEAIRAMLGDYAGVAPPNLFTARNFDSHPTDVASLHGKRFVTAIEQEANRALREALVKSLTGGDTIRTRRMREDFWEMRPTWHIHIAYNRAPRLTGTDDGIRRRLRVVPWAASFKDRPDPTVKDRLMSAAERPGILAWCLEGLRQRLAAGRLQSPQAVMIATDDYIDDEDLVGRFVADCCATDDPRAEAEIRETLAAFKRWMQADGTPRQVVDTYTANMLGRELARRGYGKRRPDHGPHRKRTVYRGLRLALDCEYAQAGEDWADPFRP